MKEWVRIYTYKTGLLSPVAHDLQLTLEKWSLRREGREIIFEAWPESLQVDGAMVRGKLEPRGISDKDRRKIRKNIQERILDTRKNPKIVFRGKENRDSIQGNLRMNGQLEHLEFPTREHAGSLRAEVEIQPSRWGISPFRALGGTIKLQDRIRVVFCLRTSPG